MWKLGFNKKGIGLMMNYVTSISYSVLVNGRAREQTVPTRGLRQGDPISHYIFIMCAEGLSAMTNSTKTRKEIKGVSVTKGGIRINHL